MKINVNLSQLNGIVVEPFITKEFNCNISQLNNLSTFLELLRKYPNPKKIVQNHDNIMMAVNYDIDETRTYWIVLERNFYFLDVGIPLNSELAFENMSTIDIELIKTLKEYL